MCANCRIQVNVLVDGAFEAMLVVRAGKRAMPRSITFTVVGCERIHTQRLTQQRSHLRWYASHRIRKRAHRWANTANLLVCVRWPRCVWRCLQIRCEMNSLCFVIVAFTFHFFFFFQIRHTHKHSAAYFYIMNQVRRSSYLLILTIKFQCIEYICLRFGCVFFRLLSSATPRTIFK